MSKSQPMFHEVDARLETEPKILGKELRGFFVCFAFPIKKNNNIQQTFHANPAPKLSVDIYMDICAKIWYEEQSSLLVLACAYKVVLALKSFSTCMIITCSIIQIYYKKLAIKYKAMWLIMPKHVQLNIKSLSGKYKFLLTGQTNVLLAQTFKKS